jgi:hypothetical protein
MRSTSQNAAAGRRDFACSASGFLGLFGMNQVASSSLTLLFGVERRERSSLHDTSSGTRPAMRDDLNMIR